MKMLKILPVIVIVVLLILVVLNNGYNYTYNDLPVFLFMGPLTKIGRIFKPIGRIIGGAISGLAGGGILGGVLGGVAGALAGGRRTETTQQPMVNPYAGEVWSYFKDTYLPEVRNKFGEVQSIFQNQISRATELQNQLFPQVQSIFSNAQSSISGLSNIASRMQGIERQANSVFNRALRLGNIYARQVDTSLDEIRRRLDNVGGYYDEAIQNARSIFESEANRGRGTMALAGFTNTPLLQRTIQEEFSRAVSPFLREKAQAQAQAQQVLSDYLFKAPTTKANIQQSMMGTGLFALDRKADALRSRASINQAQAELLTRLGQAMPSVYSSIFELGYTPARDYATTIRNFLDLQAINPTGAMNFAVVNRERSVFDPLGALAGGLLGWFGSRR